MSNITSNDLLTNNDLERMIRADINSAEEKITINLDKIKKKIDRLEKMQMNIPSWYQATTLTLCIIIIILLINLKKKIN